MRKRFQNMTEPELAAVMRRAADAAQQVLPPRSLFVLISFDDPAVAQYIANAQRTDVIRALRELADRLDQRETVERVPFGDACEPPVGKGQA